MSEQGPFDELGDYLRHLMEERGFSSQRAFARRYNLPRMTVRRLMAGERVDPESLVQISQALGVPVETFFRLCGYLPADETRSHLLREVEALLRNLSEDEQRRVRDLVRQEVQHIREHTTPAEEETADLGRRTA